MENIVRLAVDVSVRDMLNELKDITGKSQKRILLELVKAELDKQKGKK